MKSTAAILSICILAVMPLVAQETRASLSGIVTDSTGSVIPSVSIRLTNMGTDVSTTTTTNEAGLYRFLFLTPGTY